MAAAIAIAAIVAFVAVASFVVLVKFTISLARAVVSLNLRVAALETLVGQPSQTTYIPVFPPDEPDESFSTVTSFDDSSRWQFAPRSVEG